MLFIPHLPPATFETMHKWDKSELKRRKAREQRKKMKKHQKRGR